jgi:hypothetical protein
MSQAYVDLGLKDFASVLNFVELSQSSKLRELQVQGLTKDPLDSIVDSPTKQTLLLGLKKTQDINSKLPKSLLLQSKQFFSQKKIERLDKWLYLHEQRQKKPYLPPLRSGRLQNRSFFSVIPLTKQAEVVATEAVVAEVVHDGRVAWVGFDLITVIVDEEQR